jgi:acyl-CoA thioester hydrolase
MGARVFSQQVRVPYADTDQMGVVYYANYFVYFEMARSGLVREIGLPYSALEKRGVFLPVVEAHCQYRKPARYEDLLDVRTCCRSEGGVRLRIEYEVKRLETFHGDRWSAGEGIVTGYTEHVCMSPEGRVLRLIPELKEVCEGGSEDPGVGGCHA